MTDQPDILPAPDASATPPATGVEARVCEDIAARQRVGIAKYGRTVEQSPDDMIRHAYEEALDLAVYLKAEIERKRDLDRQLAEARTALEDKARLDWLEANQQTVWRSMREEWQATTEADMARRKVTVFEGWAVNGDDEPSPTIREAIDKAIARPANQSSLKYPPGRDGHAHSFHDAPDHT